MQLRRLIALAMAVTILFVQEQLLTFIPNVQFTTVLLLVFASIFSYREMLALILVYVFLDNLIMSGLNPLIMTPMFLAWFVVLTLYYGPLKQTTNETMLALFGIVIGVLYGWMFVPFAMLQTGITELWPYIMADLPFQIIMSVSNFVTIIWLYAPLQHRMQQEMMRLDARMTLTGQPISKI